MVGAVGGRPRSSVASLFMFRALLLLRVAIAMMGDSFRSWCLSVIGKG